jgi:hypothetical protein
MLAEQILGRAHPGDRLVLAAVGALRDQLVAAQAVHAAVAPGKLGRTQPGLAASRAGRPGQGRSADPLDQALRIRAMKKPDVRSRSGRSCKKRRSCEEASAGYAAPRSSASSFELESAAASTSSFSRRESVQVA